MALSRVKTWTAEVLTFTDLNAEFDNFINSALTLISPLTASLDAGSFDITALDELHFTDAVAGASAAGRLRRNGTAITWHDGTAARTVAVGTSSPTFATITGTGTATVAGVVVSGNNAIVPGPLSGTPLQHGFYRENVVKAHLKMTGAGVISASFNVTSVANNGTGINTITWDRDFADADYTILATAHTAAAAIFATVDTIGLEVGTTRVRTWLYDGTAIAANFVHVVVLGNQ